MATRKAWTEFSEEERKELLQAFDGGMNNVSTDRFPRIQELSRTLHKEEIEIKVCIQPCQVSFIYTSKIHVNKPFKLLHTRRSVKRNHICSSESQKHSRTKIEQEQKFHKNANLSIFSWQTQWLALLNKRSSSPVWLDRKLTTAKDL